MGSEIWSTGEKAGALARRLRESAHIVVFTGAGISTESGISDYRSQGGLWQRFRPVTHQEFLASAEKRREYWRVKGGLMKSLQAARPNDGHTAIAQLEGTGSLLGVITQNIDGLHQMAGTPAEKVVELHGTARSVSCLGCGSRKPFEETLRRLEAGEEIPLCRECGGLLKPDTVSFGQYLEPRVLNRAVDWARKCDLFLVVGSTLVVEPAAGLPAIAKGQGARLVILNLSATPVDSAADLLINAPCGSVLKAALALLKGVR